MRHFLTRLAAFAGLLAVSGAALAQAAGDNSVALPEPGVLELVAIAAVVGWVIRKRERK